MGELLAGALITFVLGTLLIGGVAMAGHHIAYWLAYLLAAVFTFGGFVLFDSDWVT